MKMLVQIAGVNVKSNCHEELLDRVKEWNRYGRVEVQTLKMCSYVQEPLLCM